jgi:acyl carrier protein
MTSEQPASAAGGDVLAELTAVLAGVLHVASDRIDPQQPFQILGLDSLLTVEFVSALNTGFGTRIAAAALYDHPTPTALARHITAERAAPGPVPAARESGAAQAVLDVLRRQLARILHCDPWEVDPGADFAQLGIDSLLAAEFVSGVNRAYGLAERPVTVYDHPSIGEMAAYVAARTGAAAGAVVPADPVPRTGQAPDPVPAVPAAAGKPPLSAGELDALLDAVRDNRVSLDEAVALLAARAG